MYILFRDKGICPGDYYKKSTGEKRITPAGAGKTCIPPMHQSASTDHPRRCGENTKKIL